jgi:small subunit ribosomal protein S19e
MVQTSGKEEKMTTAYDVPADVLITKLSAYLKENMREIQPTDWAGYVKTGSHVERVPQNPDWWYVRSASMLRKLYMNGPVGVSRLRKEYGGRKRRGVRPAHFAKAGGNIIRTILQQLEQAGLVQKDGAKGRVVSGKGRSLLDAMSTQIKRDLDRTRPELQNY